MSEFNIKVGEVIKIATQKRMCLIVKSVTDNFMETTVSCVKGYKPSPKSTLRNKNVFSKVYATIVK